MQADLQQGRSGGRGQGRLPAPARRHRQGGAGQARVESRVWRGGRCTAPRVFDRLETPKWPPTHPPPNRHPRARSGPGLAHRARQAPRPLRRRHHHAGRRLRHHCRVLHLRVHSGRGAAAVPAGAGRGQGHRGARARAALRARRIAAAPGGSPYPARSPSPSASTSTRCTSTWSSATAAPPSSKRGMALSRRSSQPPLSGQPSPPRPEACWVTTWPSGPADGRVALQQVRFTPRYENQKLVDLDLSVRERGVVEIDPEKRPVREVAYLETEGRKTVAAVMADDVVQVWRTDDEGNEHRAELRTERASASHTSGSVVAIRWSPPRTGETSSTGTSFPSRASPRRSTCPRSRSPRSNTYSGT